MAQKAQYFHYKIVQTFPLSELEKYKEHRRLRVFYNKGVSCVQCGITATLIGLGQKRDSFHLDLYTDDFYPLTVDHIIPKSKGGSDDLDNLQPMCCLCNFKKGNGDKPKLSEKKPKYGRKIKQRNGIKITADDKHVGKEIYNNVTNKLIGTISKFEINPHNPNKAMACIVKDKPYSWYDLSKIHIKNEK